MENSSDKNTENKIPLELQKKSDFLNKPKKFILFFTGPWTLRNAIEWTLLIIGILVIKGFLLDQYLIPSDSMEPTLHGGGLFTGDRVLVNKFIYGIRIPFTTKWIIKWGKPKRWDIVIFKSPEKKLWRENIIKRVAGLPGETITIKNGKIEINGEPLESPPDLPKGISYYNQKDLLYLFLTSDDEFIKKTITRIFEKYPYRYGCIETDEFKKVPPGHYFVLGDNSLNSIDSRYYGWIPEKDIIGKALAVWWPPNRMKDFTGFSYTWWGKTIILGLPLFLITLCLYLIINQTKKIRSKADNE
ncbi:MAG: signal peptidase I [Candidatus Hydrogenedentes bacterium]|nr:signal peptidase I [Candidatus Hydrogenedentota bacterium]